MALFSMNQVLVTVGSMVIGSLAALWAAQWAVALMGAAGLRGDGALYVGLPGARTIR